MRQKLRNIVGCAALAAAAGIFTAAPARASLSSTELTFGGARGGKAANVISFVGTMALDTATDKLTVTLTNTSANGKTFVTALAFNGANGASAKLDSASNTHFTNAASQKMKPYGTFADGAKSGGKASLGVAKGATATFVFDVTDSSPASPLNVWDFFTTPGTKAGKGVMPADMVVRLKGKHGKISQVAATAKGVELASDTTTQDDPLSPRLSIDPPPELNQNPLGNGSNPSPAAVPLPAAAGSGAAMLLALAGRRISNRTA